MAATDAEYGSAIADQGPWVHLAAVQMILSAEAMRSKAIPT